MMTTETHKGQGRAALLTLSLFCFFAYLLFRSWLFLGSSFLPKIQAHFTRYWFFVSVVLTVESLATVWALTRTREVLKCHLTDRHTRVKFNRQASGIIELQSHLEPIPWVEVPGGSVNEIGRAHV